MNHMIGEYLISIHPNPEIENISFNQQLEFLLNVFFGPRNEC